MTPSLHELTDEGSNLHKGDKFRLHAEGGTKLNRIYSSPRGEFKEGDLLTYLGKKTPDGRREMISSDSHWMRRGKDYILVSAKMDLFEKGV